MGDTKTDLVRDLRSKPYSVDRAKMECRALDGYYHDFDTQLAYPKVQLVQDLRQLGFEDLAQKTIEGHYDDEHPTAEQLAELDRQLFDVELIVGKPRRPS